MPSNLAMSTECSRFLRKLVYISFCVSHPTLERDFQLDAHLDALLLIRRFAERTRMLCFNGFLWTVEMILA